MLALGYEVTACDISPAMAERARAAAAGTATHVVVADLRDLPVLGRFDFVTSMCDSLNYLTSDRELAMAFGGVARNVRAGGLFVFDLNTIGLYRQEFPGRSAREVGGTFFLWMRDPGEPASRAGAHFSSTVEVFAPREGGRWWRSTSRHVQRHHPPELVKRLLCEAGFELARCYGQQPGGRLEPFADETVHIKVDYFARRLPADAR
jgi:SAM-dependent methyltransferase